MLRTFITRGLLLTACVAASAFYAKAHAQSLGWLERYALSSEREGLLKELIPGSEEHYLWHCLHYQVSGQLEAAETLLAKWKADERMRHSGYLQGIEDRQRLLTYRTSPERTVNYIRDRLGIELNHTAPAAAGEVRYPSELDNAQLDPKQLVASIGQEDLTRAGLQLLAAQVLKGEVQLDAGRLANLLQRVDGPWLRGLDQLVVLELKARPEQERVFGDRAAHQWLSLEELKAVATALPETKFQDAMVQQTLMRLRPSADEDMWQQPTVHRDYLERIDDYISTLPDAYLSLKAATVYQRLQLNLQFDQFDKPLFLRYLRMHRNSDIIPLDIVRNDALPRADLNSDFRELAIVPPIGNEQPLVRTYLEHFLKDAESTKEFDGLLRPDYLRTVFAETKLMSGAQPTDRWFEMLPPETRQAIRDRVELRLAPNNPRNHSVSEPSKLIVDVKKVDQLVVRIYRINTHSFYRTHENVIDTDIDLDGLVATHQRTIKFSQSPLVRHRESIELPEITGRGVWIVDLLGGGLRARAMIRRGEIQYAQTPSPDGTRFTVMNESREPLKDAQLIIAGRTFKANADGQIELPPVDQAAMRSAILHDGELATAVKFLHAAEAYSLTAGMFVDRQQLVSGQEAELVVRPRLLMSDRPIDPAALNKPTVLLTATDVEGVSTTRRFEDLELSQTGELTIRFRVPARLSSLKAELVGDVHGVATNQVIPLKAERTWDVAGYRKSTYTQTAHLTRDGKNYVIETRGRSGELVPGSMVQVVVKPIVRGSELNFVFQSDKQGRIQLGELRSIESLRLTCGGNTRSHWLDDMEVVWPPQIHAVTGIEIYLPQLDVQDELSRYRLMSVGGNDRPATDLSNQMKLADGRLQITGLAAGDYYLYDLRRDGRCNLSVTDGPIVGNIAAGKVRMLELVPRSELAIASITPVDGGFKVQLIGHDAATRVHLVVNRYLDDASLFDDLRLASLTTSSQRIFHQASGYVSELRLGEEYRYVMERQQIAKYPGVMLPHPGLLLNPWETRSTENEFQTAAAGDAPAAAAPMSPEAAAKMMKDAYQRDAAAELTPDYDFLADRGAAIFNLEVDKDGAVTIPADLIAGMPIVQIVAADAISSVSRELHRPLEKMPVRDLRLATSLDASKAWAFARGVVIAGPDRPLDMESLGAAQVQTYASVADLIRLYMTLQGDARFKEFLPLASWHRLNVDEKRATYGRLACHELHLFLSQHDAPFFEKVIKPYLANKAEKQFVDHYLLDHDLTPWTESWRYQRLNPAEKFLLARKVPTVAASIAREFRSWLELHPENQDELRRLIDTGLSSKEFDGKAQTLGFAYEPSSGAALPAINGAFGGGLGGASDSLVTSDFAVLADESSVMEARKSEVESLRRHLSRDKSVDLAKRFSGRRNELGMPFFRNLDSTKQWAENQWDHVRVTSMGGLTDAPQSPELIAMDRFWAELALAAADGKPLAVNDQLLRPISNRHAALVALAFCGLPLEAKDVALPTDKQPFRPEHDVALVTKRMIELQPMKGDPSLLVGQRFEAVDGQTDPNSDAEVPIAPEEYVVQRVYRGEVVITNPTPKQRTVDVLWQIPSGSLPLNGAAATDSKTLVMEPFAVQRIEYQFYFPAAGEFVHYPTTVGADGKLVARGSERSFHVVAVPSKLDEESWPAVAAEGSAEKIDQFLSKANLQKIDLALVAHRMRDEAIYRVVTKHLSENHLYRPELWGYSLHHRDVLGVRTLLSQNPMIVTSVGPVFKSELLDVQPVERQTYEFLEYAPLVLARIHPLKQELDILNPTFKEQYQNLLRCVAYQTDANVTQNLSLVYYLLIQNRIEQALARFAEVPVGDVETKLQYDYLAAYLALHRSDYQTAEKISLTHAEHPVPRWRERFAAIRNQLLQREQLQQGSQLASDQGDKTKPIQNDEADLALMDRERKNSDAATTQPFVKVDVDGRSLKIEHRNCDQIKVNLYAVDLELLFSKSPFVREDLASMAVVEPSVIDELSLDDSDGTHVYRLEDKWVRQTLLVEVVSGAARSTTLFYGGNLSTYVSEGYGQLQVTSSTDRQPVETAYVKVYARRQDGTVEFYKDGYTDLRGRFDYVSLSSSDITTMQRFAILVIDPERGATVQEVAPPTK